MKIDEMIHGQDGALQEVQKPNEFDKIAHADDLAFRTKKKVIYLGPSVRFPYKVVPWSAPGDPVKPDWNVIKQYIGIGKELRKLKLDLANLMQKHAPGDKPPYTAAQLDRYRRAMAQDSQLQGLMRRRDDLEKQLSAIKDKPQHMAAKAYVGTKADNRSELERVFSKFMKPRSMSEGELDEDVLNKIAALATAAQLGASDLYKPGQDSDMAMVHGKMVRQYHFAADPDAMPLTAENVIINGKPAILWQGVLPDGRRVQYWSYSGIGMDEQISSMQGRLMRTLIDRRFGDTPHSTEVYDDYAIGISRKPMDHGPMIGRYMSLVTDGHDVIMKLGSTPREAEHKALMSMGVSPGMWIGEDQAEYLQDPLDPEGDTDGPGKTGDQWTTEFSEYKR